MTKRSIRIALAALAALALISIPIVAGGLHPHGAMGHHEAMAELGLSEGQKSKVRDVIHKHMEGPLGEQMRAMRTAHDAVRDLIHDPAATDRQVQDSANAAAALAVRVAVERHRMMIEIAALLTPEQIEKARAMHKTHHGPPHGGPGDMEGF